MEESQLLIRALKRHLKAQGITYEELAAKLELSESSVKRLFSAGTFTLDRFEAACLAAGVSISKLVRTMAEGGSDQASHMTEEQEEVLAGDPLLLAILHRLLQGQSLKTIQNVFKIDASTLQKKLSALDLAELIELGPEGRIKFRVPRLIKWNPTGPLTRAYGPAIREQFFESAFEGEDNYFRFMSAPLSERTAHTFHERLRRLVRELEDVWNFDIEARERDEKKARGQNSHKGTDSTSQSHDKSQPMGLVVAMRRWNFKSGLTK